MHTWITKQKRRKSFIDLMIVATATVLTAALCAALQVHGKPSLVSRSIEAWRLYEFVPVLFVIAVASVWYSFRRTTELKQHAAEREQTEEALRKSKEKYRRLVESIDEVIYATDECGVITYISPPIEMLSGYSPAELIGRHFSFLIHQEDAPRINEIFNRVISGHLEPTEYRVVAKSGETRWVRSSSRRYFVQDRLAGLQGTLVNISERKHAEEERENLERQLVQAQKMEAIGTLAGGVAHDFNNILSPIIGYSEMALEDIPEDSLAHANLREVLKAAHRAKSLVQQILTFGRQNKREQKPLKIQPVIKEALKLLRASLPATIEITQNIDEECGPILADPSQVHQITMNLCANAYHAMRDTGGVLEVSLAEVDMNGGEASSNLGLTPGPYLRFAVSDTGHGMDREVISRIFEPYFTTKEPGEGTGLGLAMVHGIVKRHGGRVAVCSEPEKGTTFHVYLPRIEYNGETPESISLKEIPRGKEHILLVDDEEQIVQMVRQMLESLGYQVSARTSSVEAMEAFKAQPQAFDVVITDQTMPNMTGAELARELMRIRPDIPIILSTGFSELITERKAKAMGIREYVMKPIVKSEIARTVRRVLDQKSAERVC